MKNKLYRTQKLFRTPNVDEYTTILSEISIFRSKASSSSSSFNNHLSFVTSHRYSCTFIHFYFIHKTNREVMHRAFRTTLSSSLAACAALAASATLASNEGVVNVMPNIIKENEDNNVKKKWDYNWDRMDSSVQTSTTRVIHLVRHGQFNQKGKDDSKHSLTALGKKQASLAGKRLRDIIPQGTIPKRIVSSTMTRRKKRHKSYATNTLKKLKR